MNNRARKKERTSLKGFYDLKVGGVSQSAMKTYMSCRREWVLSCCGLERKGTQVNTHFGTIVHEMLDLVYQRLHTIKQTKIKQFVTKSLEEYLQKNRDEIFINSDQSEIEKEMAIIIVTEYFKFFKNDFENFSEITPEFEFAFPYSEDVTLRGKVDGVLKLKNKDIWQLEHKTKSKWNEETGLQALQFDFQNLTYSYVLDRTLPEKVKGVIYNVIRKPQLRRGKTETLLNFRARLLVDVQTRADWYFNRYEIVYSIKDKREFQEQLSEILKEMKRFTEGDLFDIKNEAHCIFPYRCPFLGVCTSGDTTGLILKSKVHPELDAEVEPNYELLKRYNLNIDLIERQGR